MNQYNYEPKITRFKRSDWHVLLAVASCSFLSFMVGMSVMYKTETKMVPDYRRACTLSMGSDDVGNPITPFKAE